MLGAVGSAETCISVFKVTFGSEVCAQLPTKKQKQGQRNKHISKRMAEEYKRSEHHDKVPVVDTAATAALVHHHPALEGAEEEYADHVTHGVCQ